MKKIKVNIITGFLGSGKTTAIINLLKQKNDKNENWAIIINEFGEISIDYITLTENEYSGKVYEITGGCICCSAQTYFHENLENIIKKNKYDRIVIEPTGLGGPDMVNEIILSNPKLKLMPTICLADCKVLDNKRLQMIPLYRNQLESADILVLSKCDLLNNQEKAGEILNELKSKYPGKISYSASGNGILDPGLLDSGEHILKNNMWIPDWANKRIISEILTFTPDTVMDIEKLMSYLKEKKEIIRAKGFLKDDSGWKLLNYTLSGSQVKISRELPFPLITLFTDTKQADFFAQVEMEILIFRK